MRVLIVVLLLFACIALGDVAVQRKVMSRQALDDARDYWDQDKMDNAIPLDTLNRDGEAIPVDVSAVEEEVSTVESGDGHDSLFFPSSPEEIEAVLQQAKRVGSHPPVSTYTTYPWRTVGKVFFSKGGLNYVCSGSVINKNLVATAGHCVYDAIGGGGWVTNFIFVPGYNNNARPYGTWYSYTLVASNDWFNYASFCKDYGFAVMQRNSGASLGDVVGYLGWTYNVARSPSPYWKSLGYPQASPFAGQINFYADSYLTSTDSNCGGRLRCAPATHGIASSATGGASGGPWVIGFGGNNYLNSVNSYKYNNQPDNMYGPYFDAGWWGAYDYANKIVVP